MTYETADIVSEKIAVEIQRLTVATERVAVAQEKIASVLVDQLKIGGALWALAEIAAALKRIAKQK